MKRQNLVVIIVFLVLFLDQALKLWVKGHMCLNEKISIFGDWFVLRFVENNGMAFGMELGGAWGKLALTSFRVVAVCLLVYYISTLIKNKMPRLMCASFALILAGAVGNILDSMFYGMLFSESGVSYHGGSCNSPAVFMPVTEGYASFMFGKVVDMFHAPMLVGVFPTWVPIWGGQDYEFFRPVFNIADAAISIGVFFLIVFNKKFFGNLTDAAEDDSKTLLNASEVENELPKSNNNGTVEIAE